MIVPAISSARAEGTLALLPTAIHEYADPILVLDSPLLLEVSRGSIVGFGGDPTQARKAEAHFDRVGRLVGGSPRAVNSWHTGIHPGTFFSGRALDDLDRWGCVAFGSPRYTHFHLVGADPGDVCGSLFDATISFDGVPFWDRGRFVFIDRPEIRDLAAAHGVDTASLHNLSPIGI